MSQELALRLGEKAAQWQADHSGDANTQGWGLFALDGHSASQEIQHLADPPVTATQSFGNDADAIGFVIAQAKQGSHLACEALHFAHDAGDGLVRERIPDVIAFLTNECHAEVEQNWVVNVRIICGTATPEPIRGTPDQVKEAVAEVVMDHLQTILASATPAQFADSAIYSVQALPADQETES